MPMPTDTCAGATQVALNSAAESAVQANIFDANIEVPPDSKGLDYSTWDEGFLPAPREVRIIGDFPQT
jgi:hypothetical protein